MKKYTLLMLLIFYLSTPAMHTVNAIQPDNPSIQSEAAILTDSETGAILFEKNANVKMYPASLTKIATAIYAIEKGHLEDMVTVSSAAAQTDGTSVFLEENEQIPLKNLIQGMLINSGNDAAEAIAEHIDGDLENFEKNLNQFLLKTVKVKNTHFTNPHGLFDENHYTTAYDLAKITNYALQNEVFREIYGTKELKWIGKSWETTLLTHHRMLKGEIPFEKITGGKTGYVPESKFTLATTASQNDLNVTAIVLKGSNDEQVYTDTLTLLEYVMHQYEHAFLNKKQIFQVNGETFTIGTKDVLMTVPIAGYQENVTKNGQLHITHLNGDRIQTISLIKKEHKTNIAHKQLAEHNKNKMMGFYGKYAIVLFMSATIGIIVMKQIKKR